MKASNRKTGRLPISAPKKGQARSKKRRNIDYDRACRACGKQGLYRESKTGFCVDCRRDLPYVVKKSGTTAVRVILQTYAGFMIDRYGVEHSARLMEISVAALRRMAKGEIVFQCDAAGIQLGRDAGPASDEAPVWLHDLPPDVVALIIERYKEFRPLGPQLAALVGPWRRPLRLEIARESPALRKRRLNRAARRADDTCHVPSPSAPLDHTVAHNAYGAVDRSGRRPRLIPMRICMGLWSLGFGAPTITRIAESAAMPTSKSAVDRICKQARRPFDGSQAIKGVDLALEIAKRPLPYSPEERARRRSKMKRC